MKSLKSTKVFKHRKGQNRSEAYLAKNQSFDPSGNLSMETHYFPGGDLQSKEEWDHYQNGKIKEQRTYLDSEELSEKFLYIYDEQDRLVRKEQHFQDGEISLKSIEYQDNKEIESTFDDPPTLDFKMIKEYNSKGLLFEETSSGPNGEFWNKDQYWYDESDNLLEKWGFDEEDKGNLLEKYDYDASGNLSLHTELGLDLNWNETKYSHDQNGNQTSQNSARQNEIWEYDEEDRVTKYERREPEVGLAEYFFREFDQRGLLIKEIRFKIGDEYSLEGVLMGRSMPTEITSNYEYEFY